MDLNLYLGFPRSSLRPRGGGLGSDLVLGSAFDQAPMEESDDLHPPAPLPSDIPPSAAAPFADDFAGLFSPNWASYPLDLYAVDGGGAGVSSSTQFDPREEEEQPGFLEQESRFRRLIELQQRLQSQRSVGLPRSFPKSESTEAVEEEEEEKGSRRGGEFECNICLDMAEEPVVTPCGHLYCWPCLYQWLHLHSSHRECPVCKGEVLETAIIPVYGRGRSGRKKKREEEEGEEGGANPHIPPRPRARRVESWRQRIRRPLSRRFGLGMSSAWRRFLGEDFSLGVVEASLQETIVGAPRRVTTRLRARRPGRGEVAAAEGEPLGLIHPFALSAFPPGFSGLLGGSSGGQQAAPDHPSGSSTMGVIQEANSAGSSRPPPLRRGGRSGSSVDAEECPCPSQGRKRRRTH